MKRIEKFMEVALAEAISSKGVSGRNGTTFRLGALIVRKGRILSIGNNSYKTHPIMLKFYPYQFLHAETSAILKNGIDNCLDTTLIVARVIADNSPALAKPCSSCLDFSRSVGVKYIYYSTKNGLEFLVL